MFVGGRGRRGGGGREEPMGVMGRPGIGGGGGGITLREQERQSSVSKWPLLRGKFYFWGPKKVGAGWLEGWPLPWGK